MSQLEWDFSPEEPLDQLIEKIASMLERDLDANQWPLLLKHFFDVVRHEFTRAGKADDALARRIVIGLATYLGGRIIYLPRGDQLIAEIRDQAIYDAWHSAPDEAAQSAIIRQAANEYGLTDRHVYRVLGAQRARRRPQQVALFGVSA